MKKFFKFLLPMMLVGVVMVFSGCSQTSQALCLYPPCTNNSVRGGSFCVVHTCDVAGCTNRRLQDDDPRDTRCVDH